MLIASQCSVPFYDRKARKRGEEMTDEEAALKIQNQCRMKAAKKKVDKKRKEKKGGKK